MQAQSNSFATSGGHWYDGEGQPAYEQPNKSKPGQFRPTTIRDAKKLNLYPSVTGILNMAAKPALERWKMGQLMMAALTLPAIEGESVKEYESRLWEDANAQSIAARDKGTEIHGIIEGYYSNVSIIGEEAIAYVNGVEQALHEAFGDQEWSAEKSFSSPLGYGGKVDLHSGMVVIDYKTKDLDKMDMKKPMSYPENIQQLSAYKKGLMLPDDTVTANVFIGRELQKDGTALVKVEVHKEDMFDRFECLLKFWQLSKGYKPE